MHPAWSIIFFTSISGLGLGLAGLIVLGLLDLSLFSHLLIASSAVFGLIGAGLLSSTLHLGHPERAWRALSQWRSSWLSREGVLAMLVLASLGCWFLFTLFFGPPPLWCGILILLMIVAATVYATSMIYGSLKTVACWHHPLTPVCYLMFSACGGSVAFLTMLALFGQANPGILREITLTFLVGAWTLKYAWWWALDNRVSISNIGDSNRLRNDRKGPFINATTHLGKLLTKRDGLRCCETSRHQIAVHCNFFWSVASNRLRYFWWIISEHTKYGYHFSHNSNIR